MHYDFFSPQQDYTKELIQQDFQTSEDYGDYILNYLLAIKDINEGLICWPIKTQNLFSTISIIIFSEKWASEAFFYTIISDDAIASGSMQERNRPYL